MWNIGRKWVKDILKLYLCSGIWLPRKSKKYRDKQKSHFCVCMLLFCWFEKRKTVFFSQSTSKEYLDLNKNFLNKVIQQFFSCFLLTRHFGWTHAVSKLFLLYLFFPTKSIITLLFSRNTRTIRNILITYTNLQYTNISRKWKGYSVCISSNSALCELLKLVVNYKAVYFIYTAILLWD